MQQNLEIWTQMAPEDVLARAAAHFGPKGAGLRLVKRLPLEAHFDGAAGSVMIAALPDPAHRRTTVSIGARDMDRDVDRFVATLVNYRTGPQEWLRRVLVRLRGLGRWRGHG